VLREVRTYQKLVHMTLMWFAKWHLSTLRCSRPPEAGTLGPCLQVSLEQFSQAGSFWGPGHLGMQPGAVRNRPCLFKSLQAKVEA